MKKIFTCTLFLASTVSIASAAQRSLNDAQRIANEMLSEQLGNAVEVMPVNPQFNPLNAPRVSNRALSTPYYVFENEDHSFIFISGSDLMPAVLGYGLEENLPADASQWPQTLCSWLEYITDVENALEQNPDLSSDVDHAQATNTVISPLLSSRWGQDWPYNLACPEVNGELSVTGCMATSISQVLYFHKWPSQFNGSYSFSSNGMQLSMNFADYSFDYTKMLDYYTKNNSTEEQQNEVAKLLRCTGQALSMRYSPEGSGAFAILGSKAFVNYIGATKAATLKRELFSLDEWNNIIQSELLASRPVVLNGQSSSGGHSFVLDGVNADGFYHVNWGWDGGGNGYFDVSILNPEDRGTGASASSDGFSADQTIVVGLCNPADNPKYYTEVCSTSSNISLNKTSGTLGQALTFSTSVENQSELAFDGKTGVVIYDANGNEYARALSGSSTHIDPTVYSISSSSIYYDSHGTGTIKCAYTFPADMPEGNYRAYMILQPEGSDDWDIVRVNHKKYSYRSFTVSGSNIQFGTTTFTPGIIATSWSCDDGTLKSGDQIITIRLKNNGDESVAGNYLLKLTDPNGNSGTEQESTPLTLQPGEEGEVSFNVNFSKSGQWKARLRVKDYCVSSDKYTIESTHAFPVAEDMTIGAVFSVTEKLSAPETLYNERDVKFLITLKNDGSDYEGMMAVRLYKSSLNTDDKNLLGEVSCPVNFAGNTTAQVTISGHLAMQLTNAKQKVYARPFYLKAQSYEMLSSSATTVYVYKADENSLQQVNCEEELLSGDVYDVMGHKLNVSSFGELPIGIYLINGKKITVK